MAGFPYEPCQKKISVYIDSLKINGIIDIKTNKKSEFCGIVNIQFENSAEMYQFLSKDYVYNNIMLNCKKITKNPQYLSKVMESFRRPRKVFVRNIPKDVSKRDIDDLLSIYGKIEEQTFLTKQNRLYNYSFVVFESHESAKECIKSSKVSSDLNTCMTYVYAKPKISNAIFKKVKSVAIKDHINKIQTDECQLDPEYFNQLYEVAFGKTDNKTDQKEIVSKNLSNQKPVNYNYKKALLDLNKQFSAGESSYTDDCNMAKPNESNVKKSKDYKQDSQQIKDLVENNEDQMNCNNNTLIIKCKKPKNQDVHANIECKPLKKLLVYHLIIKQQMISLP